ncbi:hypothetical protein PBI_JUDY_59 [Arthrobacter phage Judy]|uniref:Uncharacterized protein n=1 Tax=Arthrobacter phage Judy TaxID=2419958 RepID=A0A3G2KGM5_9CAUD|nr:hypothetical protein HOU50_gp59 [Arthrobacter phage Judy]AYN58129.1 hypothetical protein PBI_JUDY_59 [Arthrobacter phage Judy]
MKKKKVIAQAIREYGQAIRGSWGDLDGRSVLSVLEGVADELEGRREPRTLEQHRDDMGICPDGGGHWGGRWGFCKDYECPTYAKELGEDAKQS